MPNTSGRWWTSTLLIVAILVLPGLKVKAELQNVRVGEDQPKGHYFSSSPMNQVLNPSVPVSNIPPKDAVMLAHVDSTAEGKRSLGASGHAVAFERQAQPFVEAIDIFAGRYGVPEPPAEDFHVYILNEQQQILADLNYPYSLIERDELRWYTLRTPSIEVPEKFYVALNFNPSQTKGIYLGFDESVAESHSFQGLPDSGFQPVKEKHDWMVRVYMAKNPSGEKGIQRLADWTQPKHSDPFGGLTELKHDNGTSDGQQSYGGAGPYIQFTAPEPGGKLQGIRVYGSRYGGGYDPETTAFHVTVLAPPNEYGQTCFYSAFAYEPKWVDLVFSDPVTLTPGQTVTIVIDPHAQQSRGIYFHYNKDPQQTHSGIAKSEQPDKPTPDREWMIRAYVTPNI